MNSHLYDSSSCNLGWLNIWKSFVIVFKKFTGKGLGLTPDNTNNNGFMIQLPKVHCTQSFSNSSHGNRTKFFCSMVYQFTDCMAQFNLQTTMNPFLRMIQVYQGGRCMGLFKGREKIGRSS